MLSKRDGVQLIPELVMSDGGCVLWLVARMQLMQFSGSGDYNNCSSLLWSWAGKL